MLYTIVFQWGTEPYTSQVRGRTVNEAVKRWAENQPMGCCSGPSDHAELARLVRDMGPVNRTGVNSYYRPVTFRGQRSHLHVVGTSEAAPARRRERRAA